jgi:predicted nucleotide-binding protein
MSSWLFVVHGHDETAREQLERILLLLGLEPFVLQNTAGGGLTIIEALERQIGKEPEAKFGIVLMTPDDMGYAFREGDTRIQPRARQNVVMEMGMLLSSLTRNKVVILVKGHIEQPSDAHGIIYLHFNNHVKEVVPRLTERLRSAGFDIDADKITRAAS